MTDRELLELAAKAAGVSAYWGHASGQMILEGMVGGHEYPEPVCWNPLVDDGDALRLAVKMGLVIDCSRPSAGLPYQQHAIWFDELCDNATLTRRAIVRAAAEIGKSMK